MRRPLIIYVSGAPGSGKTTLARLLSRELYIPQVSSDLIHAGVRFTEGQPNDRNASLHHVFVPLLIEMAQRNISFIVDHVLKRGLSEADIIDKIKPHAEIVYLHVMAENTIDRFYQRELARTDKGVWQSKAQLLATRDRHRANLASTEAPLALGVPTLSIKTDDGYNPALSEIVTFISTHYEGGKA